MRICGRSFEGNGVYVHVWFWGKLVELGPVVLEQLCYAVSDASARIFQISLVLIFLASRNLVRCTTIAVKFVNLIVQILKIRILLQN